ncbi:flavodoxin [Streptomyces spiralis]|uniref:flavodoxin n=1 Tax=Streptomyces spiralis TaxID=66376 RepID=UPI0033E0EF8E
MNPHGVSRRKLLSLVTAGAASAAGLLIVDRRNASGPRLPGISPVNAGGPPRKRGSKTLVVYFSKTGRNYPDLNLTVGNTAQVAGFIHDRVGGDIFEIHPAEPYPADYDQTVDMAQREERERIYRDIKPGAPDTDQYGTVFLGYPIWWGEQPMAVQTFMRRHDLNGSKIVPFATHEGSGFGNSLTVIKQYYPNADVLDGYTRQGQDVYRDPDGTRTEVGSWLRRLGF